MEVSVKARQAQRNSFLVRIWRQPDQDEWRGWVQHIRTGESTFVHSLGELQAFMERWAGELQTPPRQGLR